MTLEGRPLEILQQQIGNLMVTLAMKDTEIEALRMALAAATVKPAVKTDG